MGAVKYTPNWRDEVDELTLKVQMASQMAMLKSMDVKSERDAAIERAEKAEAALEELKVLYLDRVNDLEFEFNRAEKAEKELAHCRNDLATMENKVDQDEDALERSALARRAVTCVWEVDNDGIWYTACGQAHVFFEDGPTQNNYAFCPYCGKQVWVAP